MVQGSGLGLGGVGLKILWFRVLVWGWWCRAQDFMVQGSGLGLVV